MAKNSFSLDDEDRIDTVIYNDRGQEELRVGFRTRTERDDDGNDVDIEEAENIETADGSVWNSTLPRVLGKDGLLRVCDDCVAQSRGFWGLLFGRTRPRMRYALAANIRRCNCGKNICSRHLRISHIDNHVRCRSCHRWHWLLHRVLIPIFFRKAH
ncbi:MAG: hypothetical protein IH624_13905 [Phycisphaerae bacterium]|nr:hypothetical protein [Phycisphaerae bacterium]